MSTNETQIAALDVALVAARSATAEARSALDAAKARHTEARGELERAEHAHDESDPAGSAFLKSRDACDRARAAVARAAAAEALAQAALDGGEAHERIAGYNLARAELNAQREALLAKTQAAASRIVELEREVVRHKAEAKQAHAAFVAERRRIATEDPRHELELAEPVHARHLDALVEVARVDGAVSAELVYRVARILERGPLTGLPLPARVTDPAEQLELTLAGPNAIRAARLGTPPVVTGAEPLPPEPSEVLEARRELAAETDPLLRVGLRERLEKASKNHHAAHAAWSRDEAAVYADAERKRRAQAYTEASL
jgi:hypothetical protein